MSSIDDVADQERDDAERSELHEECNDDPVDGRDRDAELDDPRAGHRGIPVDAVCTGCKRIKVKRAPDPDIDVDDRDLEPADLTSFKHVCHPCGTATWWNPISVLSGLIDAERRDQE